jgi:thiamine transport system ATP-binding protein
MTLAIRDLRFIDMGEHITCRLDIPKGRLVVFDQRSFDSSRLLAMLAGFEAASPGSEILYNQVSLKQMAPSARPLTFLFSAHNLFDHLTLFENIVIGLKGLLSATPWEKKEIYKVLRFFDLLKMSHEMPSHAPPFVQLRVALARCLVSEKPLLLMDSPFDNLSVHERSCMLSYIAKLLGQTPLTLLLGTRYVDEVLPLAHMHVFKKQGSSVLEVQNLKNTPSKAIHFPRNLSWCLL